MSVKSKTQETEIISNSSLALQTEASGSKIVELNGKKREMERIRIDDPNVLDAEIQKNQSLKNTERTKEILWIVATVIVGIVIPLISLGLILSGGPLWIEPVTTLAFVFIVIPSVLIYQSHKNQKEKYNQRILELQSYQKAMGTEEFRTFARQVGNDFTLGELGRIYDLYKNSNDYQQSQLQTRESLLNLQEKLVAFKNEIQKEKA